MTDEQEFKDIQALDCGCIVHTLMDNTTTYQPCLACALENAGLMLREAATRLREQQEEKKT